MHAYAYAYVFEMMNLPKLRKVLSRQCQTSRRASSSLEFLKMAGKRVINQTLSVFRQFDALFALRFANQFGQGILISRVLRAVIKLARNTRTCVHSVYIDKFAKRVRHPGETHKRTRYFR